MKDLTLEKIKKMNDTYNDNSKENGILRHALLNNQMSSVVRSDDEANDIRFAFNINIETLPATNQKQSGRCWIFAALNCVREIIAKKLNLDNFELSQSYVALYDKLEKVNYTLETIMELLDVDYDDRTLQFILQGGVGDGGQWDMFVNVVKKYGLVPKSVLDETIQSSVTRSLNSLLNANIRKFAAEARKAYKSEGIEKVKKMKEELIEKVYTLLLNSYGKPITTFDFEYVDKDKKYHLEKCLTPKSFYDKYVGNILDEYVSLINAPTEDKPYNKSYTIKYLGNVIEGKAIRHLNVTMDRMKELIVNTLKDGEIVWFGSDVSFYGDRETGIWDDKKFDYVTAFELDYKFSKGDTLNYSASAMNHAMCITGAKVEEDGKISKWKIENSWGTANGEKGYYIMSASWFDQYVYQAVINKKYLTEEELKAYNSPVIILKPWDPMGTLAD